MNDEDAYALGVMLEAKGLSHSEIDSYLEHFGVKGMQWGVRKNKTGATPRQVNREAKKDAKRILRAKTYGTGARTKRKAIQEDIAEKSAKIPGYKEAHAKQLKRIPKVENQILFGTLAATMVLPRLLRDMDQNPQKYMRAARFAGNASRTSIKTAKFAAAKTAKILFEKDMIVYKPGVIKPGTFTDASVVREALTTGTKLLNR